MKTAIFPKVTFIHKIVKIWHIHDYVMMKMIILFEGSFYLGMRERWTIKPNPSKSTHILKNKDQTQVN